MSSPKVLLPVTGCRLILASDGLWDAVPFSKSLAMVRSMKAQAAVNKLVDLAAQDLRVVDDVSVIVVDVLREPDSCFPTVALEVCGPHWSLPVKLIRFQQHCLLI